MVPQALFENPTIARLQQAIDSIKGGDLLFPAFQRSLVWNDDQRLRLLDSVLKGLPIGSLLIWRTTRAALHCLDRLGPLPLPGPRPTPPHNYVLDGLQRLATLYTALMGPTDEQEAEDGRRWTFYFDLKSSLIEGNEGRFHVTQQHEDVPETWLPMAALYDGKLRWSFQQRLYKRGQDALANRIDHLEKVFKDYPITIVPMTTDDLSVATQSFQRINQQGTLMGEFHMLRALTLGPNFDLYDMFQRLNDDLEWGQIPNEMFVLALKSIEQLDIYKGAPHKLVEALTQSRQLYDSLALGFSQATSFLREHCNRHNISALPYKLQMVALIDAAANHSKLLDPEFAPKFETWLWATSYAEYFTGMTRSRYQQAVLHLYEIGTGTAGPLPEDLRLEFIPTERFEPQSIRALLHMHLLARRPLYDSNGAQVEGAHLMKLGSVAFARLDPDLPTDDPANRILVEPGNVAAVRKILHDRTHSLSAKLREAHMLPTWEDPASATPESELDWRRQQLAALEKAELCRLGLTLASR